VEPDRLRFDFSHFEGVDAHTLVLIEAQVNEWIMRGYEVVTEELPIEEAKKKGAIAAFGEKYGDLVRVVEMGDASIEFCGGTHLDNTAKVGPFRIESEGSVASGVRRIEAVTGKACLADMAKNRELIYTACSQLKVKPAELMEKLQAQAEEMKELKRTIDTFKAKEAAGEVDRFLFGAHTIGEVKALTAMIPGADAGKLRQMGDMLRDKEPNVVAVLASINGEKLTFLAVCGKNAIAKGVKAGDLVKLVCTACGGSGGGKPDSAMGGGKDVTKADNALALVDDFVASKLN
jgi:alanyl-tRNA synthetase